MTVEPELNRDPLRCPASACELDLCPAAGCKCPPCGCPLCLRRARRALEHELRQDPDRNPRLF